MQANAPATPQPGTAAGMKQPFTHWPRPPDIPPSTEFEDQRRYGASNWVSHNGQLGNGCITHVTVFRRVPDRTAAITTSIIDPVSFERIGTMAAHMEPEALRELARCLIDAAADIEA